MKRLSKIDPSKQHQQLLVLVPENNTRPIHSAIQQLQQFRVRVEIVHSLKELLKKLKTEPVNVCLIDNSTNFLDQEISSNDSLVELLQTESRSNSTATQWLLLTDGKSFAEELSCDYLPAPFTAQQLCTVIQSSLKRSFWQTEAEQLENRLQQWVTRDLIGNSQAMQQLRQQIYQAGKSHRHVIIHGEAGAGSTLCAQAIHAIHTKNRSNELLHLDCRTISLEMFQHELTETADESAENFQGNYSEQYSGKTILLDHIDEATLIFQDRLISFLDQATQPCQILACTQTNLHALVQQGTFRSGLWHRLAQEQINVPPLRERFDDLPELVQHLIRRSDVQRFGATFKNVSCQLSNDGLQLLKKYHWPGNISELRQFIETMSHVTTGEWITAADIQPWLQLPENTATENIESIPFEQFSSDGLSLRMMERKLIESTLARYCGNREKTAKQLQIGVRTLSGKLREYGYPPRGGPGSNLPQKVLSQKTPSQKAASRAA